MRILDRRPLPRAELSVPIFGLGCAQLGGLFRAISDEQSGAIVDAAWKRGVRHFDTAPFYGYGLSERRLGTALRRRRRDDMVLSSKAGRLLWPDETVQPGDDGFAQPLPYRPVYDYTYGGVMRSFDDSLQRLGVGRLDILYVHDIGRRAPGGGKPGYWDQPPKGGGFPGPRETGPPARRQAGGGGGEE